MQSNACLFPTARLRTDTETMAAPAEITDLINRFEQHLDAYKAGQYNETQLRRDFLDPFFKALGWDIDNAAGYAWPMVSLSLVIRFSSSVISC